jgi:hypothetical protein
MSSTSTRRPGTLSRVGWLAAIWLMSVIALGVVASVFRVFMGFAGLTP